MLRKRKSAATPECEQDPTTATEPLTPADKRSLPGTVRRQPLLTALGLALVLAATIATIAITMRAGDRAEVVAISQHLDVGQPIPVAAMRRQKIAPADGYVPWAQRGQLAGTVTSVTILPDTLLTKAMTTPAATEHIPGKARVGLLLKPGQIPYGLKADYRVQVIHVPEGSTSAESRVLAPSARVDSVDGKGNSDNATVTVIVDSNLAPEIATYASRGEIAISELPAQRPVE
ncbi:hypothetical protein [Nonomuraea sp. B19D2]|uniref:hypothetical protein n=1 Tax=Nonomuraea sp. B19D2 TaxID=3159561 RepID=UPI0032D9B67E